MDYHQSDIRYESNQFGVNELALQNINTKKKKLIYEYFQVNDRLEENRYLIAPFFFLLAISNCFFFVVVTVLYLFVDFRTRGCSRRLRRREPFTNAPRKTPKRPQLNL